MQGKGLQKVTFYNSCGQFYNISLAWSIRQFDKDARAVLLIAISAKADPTGSLKT